MTLQELRYLVAVCDQGHFGRAAKACFVSQPTLSAGIKKLEEELGVVVFERSRRRVMLTERGRELADQARLVLQDVERLRELAEQERAPLAGDFRLGVIPTVGPYLLPHLIPALRRAHPALRLLLREQQTSLLLESLRAGRLDAALLSPPAEGADLEEAPLYEEPFFFAAPPGHPLTRRQRVAQKDLLDEAMLLLEEGHCMREQALEVCRGPRSRAREELEGASLETLRNMVAAGAGCTLLPALAAAQDRRRRPLLEIRPFARPVPRRTISLFWRRRFSRAESARELADFVRAHLPEGVSASRRSPS
jgi:LysR family hydrogen peroxide-inducible transcriptional activator